MSIITCDNCSRTFRDRSELAAVFPAIPHLLERIAPGEEVPLGECPDCKALVHLCDEAPLLCTICGEEVAESDLREHLRAHNPNAEGMEWEDVRNVFELKPDGLTPLACPSCGVEGRMAQIDLIPGYAKIAGLSKDGAIEWQGETEVDWDNQRPANNPPEYVCLACNEKVERGEIGIE